MRLADVRELLEEGWRCNAPRRMIDARDGNQRRPPIILEDDVPTRWRLAMIGVVVLGLTLPLLARVPGFLAGRPRWLDQYLSGGFAGVLFLEAFNLLAVGAAAASVALFRRGLWVLPVAAGYGYLACVHAAHDVGSDAQAGLAMIFFPIWSLQYFAGGAIVAALIHFWIARSRRTAPAEVTEKRSSEGPS